jgi:hypothetical protein
MTKERRRPRGIRRIECGAQGTLRHQIRQPPDRCNTFGDQGRRQDDIGHQSHIFKTDRSLHLELQEASVLCEQQMMFPVSIRVDRRSAAKAVQ